MPEQLIYDIIGGRLVLKADQDRQHDRYYFPAGLVDLVWGNSILAEWPVQAERIYEIVGGELVPVFAAAPTTDDDPCPVMVVPRRHRQRLYTDLDGLDPDGARRVLQHPVATERVYVKGADGLALTDAQRDPAKTYSDIGRDPDGATRYLEWTAEELAAREADRERWRVKQAKRPGRISYEELRARMTADERRAILTARRADWRVDDFVTWAASAAGGINLKGENVAEARTALVAAGVFTEKRAAEIFAS